jgi:hypothetical protein
MAPTATAARDDVLEHPAEAFAEYRAAGVAHAVCGEKHMGSRAIAVVCRDDGGRALPRGPRVRPRPRGPRALRPPRTPVPRPRMRIRGPGPGVRAS